MQKERGYAFHQWSISDVERHFEVNSREGLSEKRAHFRFQKNGPNSLQNLEASGPLKILLNQFSNFFIALLFVAAVISYFVDGAIQASVLLFIIIFNVLLGFFQEYKAERALLSLKNSVKSKVKVLRDGKTFVIDSQNVTLGDIVLLEAGDKVPCDLRVIESNSLRANESGLTGESLPIGKYDQVEDIDTPLADRRNMLYGSTTIVAGNGAGIVVAIGKDTEYGKIAELLVEPEEKTPLEGQILFIGKVLTYFSLVLVVILFIIGYFRGYDALPLATFTIAVLIGAVPESLPTIITLALAIGVSKMAKKKAIVRRMAAIETFGVTNIIATDKTGTLTDNELSIARITVLVNRKLETIDLEETHSVGKEVLDLFEKGVLCSNVNSKEAEELIGDPIDIAVVKKAISFREGIILKTKPFKRLMEIPFDSEKKYTAVLVESPGHKREIIIKGAPEKIVSYCELNQSQKNEIKKLTDSMSERGLKVIALATKKIDEKSFSTLHNLQFTGLFGLVDEPSNGIKEAIAKTITAGIRPIMITGDHPETARFVARKIGLDVKDDEIIVGAKFDKLSPKDLKKALEKVKIFARVTPEDKIFIVEHLEKAGYCVTVTGDGVNDAPAIKMASVGVAMGIRGTDVARESADVILSDDKYSTIISAIEYGRAVYDNIRNAMIFLISGNFSELFLIGFAVIFDLPLPLLTLQILWVNLITDSFPALAMAFEEPSSQVLLQKPRIANASSMKQPILYSVYLSIYGFVAALILYLWALGDSIENARTLIFTFFVALELVYAFSIRSPHRIWQSVKSFFTNKYMIVAIVISLLLQSLTFVKPMDKIFSVSTLSGQEIIVLTISIIVSFFVAELIRWQMDKSKKG